MLAIERLGKIYPNGVNALERFSADVRTRRDHRHHRRLRLRQDRRCCAPSPASTPPASGTVTLDDTKISAPHAKIGIIFQEPRLLPWLSVADNIGFGLSDLPANIRRDKVARALARVGLADKADAWPRELSGGRRSASPSRARWCRSRKCCCWTSRSPRSTPSRAGTCRITCSTSGPIRRPTLVLVTHDVDEAVVLADRVLVMRPRPGRLFEEIRINLARPRDRQSPHFDNFEAPRADRAAIVRSTAAWLSASRNDHRQRDVVTSAPRPRYIRSQ